MSLTGTALFYLLIAGTAVAVLATLLLWGVVRGPRPLRWLTRLLMIALCQATAIAVVAVWINNSYGLYSSWDDLFGENTGGSLTAAMPGPPISRAAFTTGSNGIQETYFHGKYSKLSGEVLVWTPPQYDEPQYRNDKFPVMVLLHGDPGSPQSWVDGGDLPNSIASLMASGKVKPAIVVIPVIDPGGVDTDCSDTPTRKNATWLAKDVPDLIEGHFRALPEAKAWGLIGFSTGGLCSVKLAMQYPDTFASAVAMDADPFAGDPSILADPELRKINSPLWLAKQRPDVSLFAATSAQDRFSSVANIAALQNAIEWPTTMAEPLILAEGGHNWGTWQRMFPTVFPWLSDHLDSAHAVAAKPKAKPAKH
jgi:enterochelin esterase-like enzyme